MSSQISSLAQCGALTCVFVGSMYLWPDVHRDDYRRDDSASIKRRLVSGVLSAVAGLVAWSPSPKTLAPSLSAVAGGSAAVAQLFLGVATTHACRAAEGLETLEQHGMDADNKVWYCLRNFVVAPITEELVFRGAMIHILRTNGNFSLFQSCAISGVFFVLAHVHHVLTSYARGQMSLKKALVVTAVNAVIHTAFSSLSSWVYVRNGMNVWAPIVAHSLCNLLGAPVPGLTQEIESVGLRRLSWVAYGVGIALFFYQQSRY